MGANPTIYCLENLTDFYDFERLCTDLMALEGYPSIKPLGGFSDKIYNIVIRARRLARNALRRNSRTVY